jgi:hypothetical protein
MADHKKREPLRATGNRAKSGFEAGGRIPLRASAIPNLGARLNFSNVTSLLSWFPVVLEVITIVPNTLFVQVDIG